MPSKRVINRQRQLRGRSASQHIWLSHLGQQLSSLRSSVAKWMKNEPHNLLILGAGRPKSIATQDTWPISQFFSARSAVCANQSEHTHTTLIGKYNTMLNTWPSNARRWIFNPVEWPAPTSTTGFVSPRHEKKTRTRLAHRPKGLFFFFYTPWRAGWQFLLTLLCLYMSDTHVKWRTRHQTHTPCRVNNESHRQGRTYIVMDTINLPTASIKID